MATFHSPIRAMLAEEVDTLSALTNVVSPNNPSFVMQEKIDGFRLLVVKWDDNIRFLNRKGDEAGFKIWPNLKEAISSIPGNFILDGEYVGGEYYVFDCLLSNSYANVNHKTPYLKRLREAWRLVEQCDSSIVHKLRTYEGHDKPRAFTNLQSGGAEGVIFRATNALYYFGKPAASYAVLKYKFWKTLDAIVYRHSPEGKASVELALFDEAGGERKLVPVGGLSTPQGTPPYGSVVEVRYLRFSEHGRLITPTFLRVRDDKSPLECTTEQIKQMEHND